jgi:hypothetical protein
MTIAIARSLVCGIVLLSALGPARPLQAQRGSPAARPWGSHVLTTITLLLL